RYPEDLKRAMEEVHSIPERYLDELEQGRSLAAAMRTLFPPGSEGERLVVQLEFCMDRALKAGSLGVEALSEGRPVEAWRHLQIVMHEVQAHRQDIAFLRATRRTLDMGRSEASSDENPDLGR
ncbi:MAG: hypothetical protein AAFW75_32385, partial [Cyanobacteria bacterium J06636_16]